jgi:hypothetical protein
MRKFKQSSVLMLSIIVMSVLIPSYWIITVHAQSPAQGASAVYIIFGKALGFMNGRWIDIHGAGAQRSDPKTGNPEDYPYGRGPQGDAIRIYNYVRAVRGGVSELADYVVVDTGQTMFYDTSKDISLPQPGEPFHGQDAQYEGAQPSYQDNDDGTVTDLVTGLMWQKSPDRNGDGVINSSDKLYYDEAVVLAASFNLAGYTDWRLPTIKELYSLIMFSGIDLPPEATSTIGRVPFINTTYFNFGYGDLSVGERLIDAQYASSTLYVGSISLMFGVNFADGRIKGYPAGMQKNYYVLYVRGGTNYGINHFVDNGDGTITDNATGLMWMKNDNGEGISWENALSYAEGLEYAGYTDWRLPNAKELQSIVDYTRSSVTTNSAAIDPLFTCSQITNEAGEADYPFYWTSTTHSLDTAGGVSTPANILEMLAPYIGLAIVLAITVTAVVYLKKSEA